MQLYTIYTFALGNFFFFSFVQFTSNNYSKRTFSILHLDLELQCNNQAILL